MKCLIGICFGEPELGAGARLACGGVGKGTGGREEVKLAGQWG